jgi:hypothetical protein
LLLCLAYRAFLLVRTVKNAFSASWWAEVSCDLSSSYLLVSLRFVPLTRMLIGVAFGEEFAKKAAFICFVQLYAKKRLAFMLSGSGLDIF